jgi:hypothetical protein
MLNWNCHQQAAPSVRYTTSCKQSLVLLTMGEIIARNILSWLKLLINCYCCIYLVVYTIVSVMHGHTDINFCLGLLNSISSLHMRMAGLSKLQRRKHRVCSQSYWSRYCSLNATGWDTKQTVKWCTGLCWGHWSPWPLVTVTKYRYAPHKDVSVNDGPHIRRWSGDIIIWYCNIIVVQLPTEFSTVTCCTGL